MHCGIGGQSFHTHLSSALFLRQALFQNYFHLGGYLSVSHRGTLTSLSTLNPEDSPRTDAISTRWILFSPFFFFSFFFRVVSSQCSRHGFLQWTKKNEWYCIGNVVALDCHLISMTQPIISAPVHDPTFHVGRRVCYQCPDNIRQGSIVVFIDDVKICGKYFCIPILWQRCCPFESRTQDSSFEFESCDVLLWTSAPEFMACYVIKRFDNTEKNTAKYVCWQRKIHAVASWRYG